MKQLLLITIFIFSTGFLFAQKNIDKKINGIEVLTNKKVYRDTSQLKGWSVERGNYLDTAIYIYTVEINSNVLVKATYIQLSDSKNITYYFDDSRLIAAKIILDNDFPSWHGSLHYFKKPNKLDSPEIIDKVLGSETEADIRKFLLHDGYQILKYFQQQIFPAL